MRYEFREQGQEAFFLSEGWTGNACRPELLTGGKEVGRRCRRQYLPPLVEWEYERGRACGGGRLLDTALRSCETAALILEYRQTGEWYSWPSRGRAG